MQQHQPVPATRVQSPFCIDDNPLRLSAGPVERKVHTLQSKETLLIYTLQSKAGATLCC